MLLRGFGLAMLIGACTGSIRSGEPGSTTHDGQPSGDDTPEDAGAVDSGSGHHQSTDAGSHDQTDAGSDSEQDSGFHDGPTDAGSNTEPDAGIEPPAKRVVPLYITASDESEVDTARYVATYNAIIDGVRSYYTDRLAEFGDYAFYREHVRVLHGHYTRAQWDDFGMHGFVYPDGSKTEEGGGCSMYYGALHELTTNGLLAAEGLPQPGTSGLVYYAINGGGKNGSCGAGGFLAASELNLIELAAQSCPTGRKVGAATDCSPVGAIAHELGHGFGLPHGVDRPTCTDGPSLMDQWWLYDGVGLCVEDRTDLMASGFFTQR